MVGIFTNETWMQLVNIPDKAFKKALRCSEFVWMNPNGQREFKVEWLYPWACSDECGNSRFSFTAPAIRDAWPDHTWFNRDNFLPEARRQRYE